MINVVAVTSDARPISAQFDTWQEAVQGVVRWSDNNLYCRSGSIVRVFMSEDGRGIEEHRIENLRGDLAAGLVACTCGEAIGRRAIGTEKCAYCLKGVR